MRFLKRFSAALVLVVVIGCITANADTLTGSATADNAFTAYISTSNSVLGTEIGSGIDWTQSYSLTATTLTPGTTYYLHIIATNISGPEAFIGAFSLAGTNFQFSNGTQSLFTNTTDWTAAIGTGTSAGDWTIPVALAVLETYAYPNPSNLIKSGANWIWTAGEYAADGDIAYLSTTITPTPEPGSIILLGSGLLGLAGVVRRKLGIGA